jgi:two-component system nitrate/nitrite sensor histidine kinase NarX
MSPFRLLREQPLLLRLGLAIGAVTLLALLSVLTAAAVAKTSTGEANAINNAGSLRMLAWRAVSEADGHHADRLSATLDAFDQRLSALQDSGLQLATHEAPLTDATRQIRAEWHALTAPATLQRERLLERMPLFVAHVDQLVHLLETDLETKILWLRWIQGALLFLIVALAVATLMMMKHQNGRLASLVGEKTRELQHSNRSLELLYRTTTRLSEGELTQDKLLALLQDVEDELGLGQGIICVRQNDDERAYPLATHIPETERAELCDSLGCSICFGSSVSTTPNVHLLGERRLVSVPLTGGGQWQGVMPFQLPPGTTLEPWQTHVLETLGRHVATALANTRRAEERHRLAVYEERSVIARELHDSIAQSLSYLKIQIALLQSRIRETQHTELLPTVEELKVGLGMAYSELRELLTTFRLSPGQTPFTEELDLMIHELSRRCGFAIQLDQRMGNMELSANEEVHLTSIIREALINISRHAEASWARVTLSADTLRQVAVTIEDNGIGMAPQPPNRHHYGLTIMRDRAAILEGQLHFEARAEGGTRVRLNFVAQTPYAHDPHTI